MPVTADPVPGSRHLDLQMERHDAMPSSRVLRFTTRKIEVTADPELEAATMKLTISDAGVGMPK